MGIFSGTSPFEAAVEKATQETSTKEDWSLILDVCDKVSTTTQAPRECLRAIMKRMNHQDPHVVLQAITLLDACVSNCGLNFHLEIASREFEQEFRKLLNKIGERTIRDKLLMCLNKWSENEFKSNPQLELIPSLCSKLKQTIADFPTDTPGKSKKSGGHGHHSKRDHSTGSSSSATATRQEEADIAKAIELSLKEAQMSPPTKSLYPQTMSLASSAGASTGAGPKDKEPRKVRALYDFEAAEDNELTFYAGEIVHVLDDTDANWWEGTNQRGTGLFPANFVSADLSAEPIKFDTPAKKSVQFADEVEVKTVDSEQEVLEVDETKIDKTLAILHDADPTGDVPDPPELAPLEEQVQQMGPLIDQELEKIDRRHAQLTRLGTELVEALNLYHNLMREPVMPGGYMKMGPNISGPSSLPGFPHAPGMQPQFQNYGYDPNVMAYQNSMMMSQVPGGVPGSAQGGGMYGPVSLPYQPPPQHNGMPPVSSPTHINQNQGTSTMSIPNNQHSASAHQQSPMPHVSQMHPGMQTPISMQNIIQGSPGGPMPQFQPIMMPPHMHGPPMHIPPQSMASNQMNSLPPLEHGPVSVSQGAPQQFTSPQQFYPNQPANAPTM